MRHRLRTPQERMRARRALMVAFGSLLVVAAAAVATRAWLSRDPAGTSRADRDRPPEGFTVISDTDTGFSIAVPAHWQQLPLDAGTYETVAASLRDRNPDLAAALANARNTVGTGGKLLALDPRNVATSVNLVAVPANGATPATAASQAASVFTRIGGHRVGRKELKLAGTKAVRQRFRVPVKSGTETVVVTETQYYLVHRDNVLTLTLAGVSPELDRIPSTLRLT